MDTTPPAREKIIDLTPLLDLRFKRFITVSIVKVLYLVGIAMVALTVLTWIIAGFTQGAMVGIAMLVLSPLFLLLGVILLRIYLEVLVVLFRIAENTARMAGTSDRV